MMIEFVLVCVVSYDKYVFFLFIMKFGKKKGTYGSLRANHDWVPIEQFFVFLPKQRGLKKLFNTFCVLNFHLFVVGVKQHFRLEEGGQEQDIFRGDVEGDGQQVFLFEASDVVVKKIAEGLFRHLLRHCPPRQLRSSGSFVPL